MCSQRINSQQQQISLPSPRKHTMSNRPVSGWQSSRRTPFGRRFTHHPAGGPPAVVVEQQPAQTVADGAGEQHVQAVHADRADGVVAEVEHGEPRSGQHQTAAHVRLAAATRAVWSEDRAAPSVRGSAPVR